MDGIIIMDKPEDFTSFDMVAKLRRLLGTRKVGRSKHAGPMARRRAHLCGQGHQMLRHPARSEQALHRDL